MDGCNAFDAVGEWENVSEHVDLSLYLEDESESKNGDKKQKSRFKVARVDFKEKPVEILPEEVFDDEPQKSPKSGLSERAELTIPTQIMDTYNNPSYDTRNLKTFGQNTLETLPHLDHYRNLLSATGAMKKRPTLLELHDIEQVRSLIVIFLV